MLLVLAHKHDPVRYQIPTIEKLLTDKTLALPGSSGLFPFFEMHFSTSIAATISAKLTTCCLVLSHQ